MSTVAVALFFPWGASIAVFTRRSEQGFPILSYTQIACVGMCGIVALFMSRMVGRRFPRRMRSRRRRRTINDFGWFLYLYTWPPFSVWALAIALGDPLGYQ